MPVSSSPECRKGDRRSSYEFREPYERDRDRILYSEAFRRLKGVAQVAHSEEAYQYHTRLTHSLKVSQVGRRCAQYLKRSNKSSELEISPTVVSAASLAHDLGHPPFGHPAEEELDQIIADKMGIDYGFEGNPQSLRIVSKVETDPRNVDNPDTNMGLNLTRATLNAMIKYPWKYGDSVPGIEYDTENKFGYYGLTEQDLFDWIRDESVDYVRSPEAILMDWADDVTYAVHDLIDFYKTGLVPLHEILQETEEREKFINHFESEYADKEFTDDFDPEAFISRLLSKGIDEPEMKQAYSGSKKADALLSRFQSERIEEYLDVSDTVQIVSPEDARSTRPATEIGVDREIIDIDPRKRAGVEFLKELTKYYVIDKENLITQQQGHREIVNTLFELFMSTAEDNFSDSIAATTVKKEIIPQPLRRDLLSANSPRQRARVSGDIITLLTEKQASRLYSQITGRQLETVQEVIF